MVRRLRKIDSVEARFKRKIGFDYETGCWPWMASLDGRGYGQLGGGRAGAPNFRAHRVSWEMHRGPIPSGMNVLHSCDNRRCVNPTHLFLGTKADNTQDMWKKGRNTRRKVTDDQVHEIRASALPYTELARTYGIASEQIRNIKRGYSFKHLLGGSDG